MHPNERDPPSPVSDKAFMMTQSSFSSLLSKTEVARRIFKASNKQLPGPEGCFISAAAVYLLLCSLKLKYVAMLCTEDIQPAPKCSCTDAQTYKSNDADK